MHLFTDNEFFDSLRIEANVITLPDYVLTPSDAIEMLTWRPDDAGVRAIQYTGGWDDLPASSLSNIGASFAAIQRHAFYEIAFKAKTEMVELVPNGVCLRADTSS